MANYTPNDPMAKPMLVGGLVLIGVAVFVLVSNLVSTIEKNSIKGEEDNTLLTTLAEENIQPVGNVVAVDKSIAKAPRSGEQVYQAVCTSCHAAGVLGAPITGDKGQWEARSGDGLAGLLKNAVNGLNSMPAKGGDPTLTEEELTNAILYMVKDTGLDLGGETAKAEETPAKTEAAPEAAEVAPAKAEAAPEAPKAEEKATEEAPAKVEAAPEAPKAEEKVAEEAPAKAEAAPEAPKAEEKATEEAPAKVEAAPEAPKAEEKVAEEAPAKAEAAPEAPKAEAKPAAPAVNGEKIYKSTCFACHDSGIAASPILGKKADWDARIAQGMEALYASSLNGKGVMPAKGGNPALSDEAVKAAVDYMVGKVQ